MKLMDIDPFNGIRTYHHYDHQTDVTSIQRVQNVEPILEANKRLQNTDHEKQGIKHNWWHAAMIPIMVIEKWLVEDGINAYDPNDIKAVKKKLNDPEWRYLRTGRGKL